MTHGGQRSHSGRKPRDTVRLECSVPRSVYEELCERERSTGIYRTRIAAEILSAELVVGMVNRDNIVTDSLS